MSSGTQGLQQGVAKDNKPLWEPYTVWTFIVLEEGENVSEEELVAGFDRVVNSMGLEGLIAPGE